MLLTNGARGATLRLQVEADPTARIEFKKYIKAHGDVGLSVVIEDSKKMRAAYDQVANSLSRVVTNLTEAVDRRPRLEIDIGTDLPLAEQLSRQAFEAGLGLSLARDVVGYYDLVLLRNVPRLTGVETDG
jgi:hypothetical protein